MLTYDEFFAEAARLKCRVLPQGDDLRVCLDAKDAEIESLKLAEEAAKEVFGVVVQQKRELEAEGRELRRTISAQQEIIVKLNQQRDRLLTAARTARTTLERDSDEWGLCAELSAAISSAI